MASATLLVTAGNDATQTLDDLLKKAGDREGFAALARLFHAAAGGNRNVKVQVGVAAGSQTAATGTAEPAQASITAGDILYVGSVGFVATNSAVTLGDATYDMRTSDAAVATSIAAQVNAHTSLTGVVTAAVNASDNTQVDFTAAQPGAAGNHITLAKVDTTDASMVLNGLANTVHQSTLTGGDGGDDASPSTYSTGQA